MLEQLAAADTIEGCGACIPAALEMVREAWAQLARGEIPPVQLLVEKTVSRELEAYQVNTAPAIALRQLRDLGLHLHPGERVRYLIRDARSRLAEERVRAFRDHQKAGANA